MSGLDGTALTPPIEVMLKERVSASARTRDRLIRDCFGVDYALVWDVVRNKIPRLRKEVEEILRKEGSL
ncbi:MAG: HepT-like ribonuclease domain-containing protein [Syntrophorhabdales bacterium]